MTGTFDAELPSYRRSSLDRGYWLGHCHGFVVSAPGGRIGVVEEIVYGEPPSVPTRLVVRAGLLGRRRLVIGVEQVAEVVPRETKIMLNGPPVLL
jgi:hypothetical protein